MSDLIDRQAAIELIHTLYPNEPIMRMNRKWWEEKYKPFIECEKALERLPSAQPEIIRCKDCKWWTKQEDSLQGRCALLGMYPTGGWYCANAKRRPEET